MKTKYFKSTLYAAALSLSLMGVSCTADDVVAGKDIEFDHIESIYDTKVIMQDAKTVRSMNVAELYKEGYTTELKVALTKALPAAETLALSVDEEYVAKYNAANETAYQLFPGNVMLGENGSVEVAANATTALAKMVIAPADLKKGVNYMLPVKISSNNEKLTLNEEETRVVYIVKDMVNVSDCFKGEQLPKGFLFFEVNDANPLNALAFELENGKLLWDVVVLFAANINYDSDAGRPFVKCNPNVQFLLDNHETYIQPLRKRGIKVLLGLLGNHDAAGLAQLSKQGAKDFAAEVARYCEAYQLDGVNYDDEYSSDPDLDNPAFDEVGTEAAARLCYETKKAMPNRMVTVYDWGMMYGTETVDGVDADEWIDVVVPNYGDHGYPIGKMSMKKVAGIAAEFNGGFGDSLNQKNAQMILDEGYGWHMGFAPDPMKADNGMVRRNHWNVIFGRLSGAELFYGSKLKNPTIFYKKNDPKAYVYPDELPYKR